jgi:hypothetical protein
MNNCVTLTLVENVRSEGRERARETVRCRLRDVRSFSLGLRNSVAKDQMNLCRVYSAMEL